MNKTIYAVIDAQEGIVHNDSNSATCHWLEDKKAAIKLLDELLEETNRFGNKTVNVVWRNEHYVSYWRARWTAEFDESSPEAEKQSWLKKHCKPHILELLEVEIEEEYWSGQRSQAKWIVWDQKKSQVFAHDQPDSIDLMSQFVTDFDRYLDQPTLNDHNGQNSAKECLNQLGNFILRTRNFGRDFSGGVYVRAADFAKHCFMIPDSWAVKKARRRFKLGFEDYAHVFEHSQ